ncbi:glycosyltransferase [Coraliomargarita parva]|uniref:glycosyltransferase n=1 Tax=Coraliomargarita parva TaxID=3014050 RepID=UPI0022B58825|nr:glycosyltransferase [Coraliomargarita parva]
MLKIDIYWDLRSTIPSRHTGVGKHVIEVIRGLRASGQVNLRVLLAKDQMHLWEDQSKANQWEELAKVTLPWSLRAIRLRAAVGLTGALNRLCRGRDLVYSPMELLLVLKTVPFINTVHGMPCFEVSLPDKVYRSLIYRWERLRQANFFRLSRRHCACSFVVSDYLKDRMVKRIGFASNFLHTVYNGAEDFFFQPDEVTPDRARRERLRLLQVGGANIFDGAPALLQVARYLEKHYPTAKIWIAGDRHEAPWEHRLQAMSNVVWHGFLDSRRLLEEMRRATALLYVPAVESFGIIGVEAMAAGLPILASRSTALPEVLGDAACWIDPADEASIEDGLHRLCLEPENRRLYIEAGRRQAAQYTWASVVERVLCGFRKAVG